MKKEERGIEKKNENRELEEKRKKEEERRRRTGVRVPRWNTDGDATRCRLPCRSAGVALPYQNELVAFY